MSSAPGLRLSALAVGAGSIGRRHIVNRRGLEALLHAMEAGGRSPVPLEEGVRDLEPVQAFRESAAGGRRAQVRRIAACGV